jgi:prohibitin 2
VGKPLFIIGAIVLFVTLALLGGCVGQIDEGEEGVKTFGGQVVNEAIEPGYYVTFPGQSIYEYSTRSATYEGETNSYTKDVQQVNVKYTFKFNLNKGNAGAIYRIATRDWEGKLVADFMNDSLKSVIGKYEAVSLVQNRDKAAYEVQAFLQQRVSSNLTQLGLPASAIQVTMFTLNDLTFKPEFEEAVESKVIAVQQAEKAENETVRIREEAIQAEVKAQGEADATLARAKAEAEAMRIKNEALAQSPKLIDFTYAQGFADKWDGAFPTFVSTGGGSNNVNLMDLTSKLVRGQ